ncbi:hypothetical protein PVAP13_3NG127100 [Panicum virgatum]|uniref:Peptidase A1 domain-containing protein n=1 Tax=Panicum virgatum TaxID=38727 RepID=A0A8T0UC64_PANVG|nr:hypothetical protein PVAP13_3NG127100 [Panicum virgatum]
MRRLYFHHYLAVPVLVLAAAVLQETPPPPSTRSPSRTVRAPLVVDLAGPLVWSSCAFGHPTFPCGSAECHAAGGFCWHQQGRPWQQDYGAGAEVDGGDHDCACTARACDPVTRDRCAPGDLTTFAMSANATDGRNALYPAPFQAVGACAPDQLLRSRSLPAGAAGVAGFGRAPLSLPAQLAARLGCGYYLPVEAISVSWPNWNAPTARAALPPGALELDAVTGRGGVALSTVQRYTAMRPDVYRAFVRAFNETIGTPGYVKPMPAVAPFELCFDTFSLRHVRVLGWDVPSIRLELGAGASMDWTVASGNSMVQAADRTLCLAVIEMGPGAAAPAVVIGGYQVEDNLLVFDMDKEVLHFSGLLWGSGASCSGFNFTAPQ